MKKINYQKKGSNAISEPRDRVTEISDVFHGSSFRQDIVDLHALSRQEDDLGGRVPIVTREIFDQLTKDFATYFR